MRIIPVSSGKGGVGKTTFATNLALTLSKTRRTVLVDLDTGTSSLRNCLNTPVKKDMYHLLKKGAVIDECLTTLDKSLDPEGIFKNFSFLASPRNFIHDIVNFTDEIRDSLINHINSIKADIVILDMKAGLDYNVIDFLPFTNTGIILFTPKNKAATMTAAEIIKAILFRMIRIIFSSNNPFLKSSGSEEIRNTKLFHELISIVEDGYDEQLRNLDEFITMIQDEFPDEKFIHLLKYALRSFRVFFVLNMFNSVEESSETVVKPFVDNIFNYVSSDINLHNLGWVIRSENIYKSTEKALPYLLSKQYEIRKKQRDKDKMDHHLRDILGIAHKRKKHAEPEKRARNEMKSQLDMLKNMYMNGAGSEPEANFNYISERVSGIIYKSSYMFGMNKVMSPAQFLEYFLNEMNSFR